MCFTGRKFVEVQFAAGTILRQEKQMGISHPPPPATHI